MTKIMKRADSRWVPRRWSPEHRPSSRRTGGAGLQAFGGLGGSDLQDEDLPRRRPPGPRERSSRERAVNHLVATGCGDRAGGRGGRERPRVAASPEGAAFLRRNVPNLCASMLHLKVLCRAGDLFGTPSRARPNRIGGCHRPPIQRTGGACPAGPASPTIGRRHRAGGFPANTISRAVRILRYEGMAGLRRFENT